MLLAGISKKWSCKIKYIVVVYLDFMRDLLLWFTEVVIRFATITRWTGMQAI